MSVTITLPGALQELADGRSSLTLDSAPVTLAEAMATLHERWPAVYDRIMTEKREVRPHVNLFIDDMILHSCITNQYKVGSSIPASVHDHTPTQIGLMQLHCCHCLLSSLPTQVKQWIIIFCPFCGCCVESSSRKPHSWCCCLIWMGCSLRVYNSL